MKRFLLFLLAALPLVAAEPSYESDDLELEGHLAPLKDASAAGNVAQTRQVYLNYGMAGKEEQAEAWAARFLEQLQAKADKGDAAAMQTLGRVYLAGDACIEPDAGKAVIWLTKAGDAGDAAAAYLLGDLLSKQGDAAQARVAYARAYGLSREQAEQGNADARTWQAYMQLEGIGCEANPAEGRAALEKLSAEGDIPATYQLFKYLTKQGDEAATLRCARLLADKAQDPQMAYIVADAYLKGKGVDKDEELGKKYLDVAVKGGIPAAQFHAAWLLEEKGDLAAAFPLYRAAASQGHAEAAVKTGTMLLHGRGTEADEATGLLWLQRASDTLKSPVAPYELARYYEEKGEQDMADSWYIIASDRHLAEAMCRRGLLHLIPGSGVDWSPTEAYHWWKSGSAVGNKDCILALRLYLWVFTPLLLVFVFGLPIFITHRLVRKQVDKP